MSTSLPSSDARPRLRQQTPTLGPQVAHVVQLYTDDNALLDMLCRFIGGAIAVGEAGVVIATQAHHDGLMARLNARGLDTATAISQGRLIPVSAEDILARIMLNGELDEGRFKENICDILTRAEKGAERKDSCIAVFGELVALLWAAGNQTQAIRVEQLWNKLNQEHHFSLLCAYPITGFDKDRHIEPFLKMCTQHSGVIPSESPVGVTTSEERLQTIAELQQKSQELQQALVLRQSEERFRLLVEAVQDYAIFMLDPQGNVVSWNPGAQRIKGYLGAEIIGRHFSCFYPSEDLQRGKPQWELEVATREGHFDDEGWRLRKDGTRFWASVVISAVHDDSGKLIGFGKVTRDFTERMERQEALRQEIAERRDAQRRLYDSEQSLRQLSRHLLRTQEEERRRIGRELHDSLGQSLAALKINLDSLSQQGVSRQQVEECLVLADNAIKEVRTISYLLYPPMLEEMGLKSAILWYLDGFSVRSGIQTTFDLRADFGRLHRDSELVLFRVLQESLTNIHRHSGSQTADIKLSTKNGVAILEVNDRGKGLSQRESSQSGAISHVTSGVGLRSMTERVTQLGGKLEVNSTSEGTTVRAEIPAREFSLLEEKLG